MKNKILIISGPTGVGKTRLALKLAKDLDGELVSADSRQVYKGMDIVTGKDLPANSKQKKDLGCYEIDNIKIWGLDLVEPDQEFDVSMFIKVAREIINDVWVRGKLPIVVGGTGFYLKNLIQPASTIGIPIDKKLRQKLDKLPVEQLQKKLQKLNPQKWEQMNNSDCNNPRRLVRAIEIFFNGKNKNLLNSKQARMTNFKNNILMIGLKIDKNTLEQKIKKRVEERIKAGAETEVEKLLAEGYSWDLPAMSAIGYRDWRDFIEGKQDLAETTKLWQLHEIQYAKRQMTYMRKIKEIKWFDVSQKDWLDQVGKNVEKWVK